MAWDKDLPDGDLDAAQLDDDVRTNNDALEDALDLEHYFATGGSQHGRHKFGIGNTAARDALANISNGMIYFNTDALSGYTVLQVRSSGSWVNASILDTTVARLGLQNLWTKPQYATWETLTLSGGNLTIDFSTSPKKKANIGANFTVLNPSNDTPGPSASSEIVLDLTMTGAGGWTVTWGSEYRGPNGIAPVISSTTGHVTRDYISGMADGNYLVTTLPNIADI